MINNNNLQVKKYKAKQSLQYSIKENKYAKPQVRKYPEGDQDPTQLRELR